MSLRRPALVLILLLAGAAPARSQSVFEAGSVYTGTTDSFFGWSVAGPGDVDLDGVPDSVVAEVSGAGTVHVYSGMDGSTLHAFVGDASGDSLGSWVSGAGDIDQDGAADIVAGATGDDDFGSLSGSVRVFSGATGAVLYTFHGDSAGDRLGSVVSGGGDVDNDGFPDLAAGSVFDQGTGTVRVWSGFDGSVLHVFPGVAADDGFGFRVDITSDFDGDGHVDVVGAAPWNDDIGTSRGHVRVFSGATGNTMATLYGKPNQTAFAEALDSAGDVDQDGRDDLIIGIPYYDTVSVYSGKLDGSVLLSLSGNPPVPALSTDKFGVTAAGVGDVDGDGHPDVAVGAVEDDDGAVSGGTTYVFSGANGQLIDVLVGQVADGWFGWAIDGLGDVDQDGSMDLIVGSRVALAKSGIGRASTFFAPGSSTTPYGTGCAGAGGFVPNLSSPPGLWVFGKAAQVSITAALGGSTALLLVGSTAGSTHVGGCTFLVSPLTPLPVPLALSGVGPGTGEVTVAGTLPLLGGPTTVTMQAIVADASHPNGFSATNALEIEIH